MKNDNIRKIIAVTACPTGIAHTFMAEEALKLAAKKLNVEIKIETNGASGVENEISQNDLENSIGVIIAADKDININRFNGFPVLEVGVKDGINKAEELINKILNGEVLIRENELNNKQNKKEKNIELNKLKNQEKIKENNSEINKFKSIIKQNYNHLMNGFSEVLPFLIIYGLFLFIQPKYLSNEFYFFTNFNLNFKDKIEIIILAIFSGFIARSIAGKIGMFIGFIGGILIDNILGIVFIGFLSGYFINYVNNLLTKLPRDYEGLKSIFILPLIGVLFVSLVGELNHFFYILNEFLFGLILNFYSNFPIILGIIIGFMVTFDCGGPINKIVYILGAFLLFQGNNFIMAGVSAACITPPLVVALSTTLFKKYFNNEEIIAGSKNYLLGFSHITEGAIPFIKKDPKKINLIIIIASTISCILSFIFKIEVPAPHGGFLLLPFMDKPITWFLCIFTGSLFGALLFGIYKLNQAKNIN